MSKESKALKSEEARALLVLGFLAVLASIRSQTINVDLAGGIFPLNGIIDTTILLMSLYTVCLLLAYSKDMIGERLSEMLRYLAVTLLSLSFLVLVITGAAIGIAYFQWRFLGLVGIIATALTLVGYYKFKEKRKKKTPKIPKPLDKYTIGVFVSSTVFVVSIVALSAYSPEQYLIIPFITAVASMGSYFFFAKRKSEFHTTGLNEEAKE